MPLAEMNPFRPTAVAAAHALHTNYYIIYLVSTYTCMCMYLNMWYNEMYYIGIHVCDHFYKKKN